MIESTESNNSFIKVTSEDGKEFSISSKAASLSKLLVGALQDFSGDINMPLQEVNAITTEKIVEYLEHWQGESAPKIEKPIKSGKMVENCDEWSAAFIDAASLEEVGDLAVAANFMEIQPLVDLACAKIASICFGKTDEELLKEHGIDPASFTEEERQKIREENADWLEDDPEKFFNFEEDEK
jgi:S-phase kinase-associated protein 1